MKRTATIKIRMNQNNSVIVTLEGNLPNVAVKSACYFVIDEIEKRESIDAEKLESEK